MMKRFLKRPKFSPQAPIEATNVQSANKIKKGAAIFLRDEVWGRIVP